MTRVTDGDGSARIDAEKLTVIDEGEATVYLETPDHQPLSAEQLHATIRIVGDEYRGVVDLDADGLEALADAVDSASTRFQDGEDPTDE